MWTREIHLMIKVKNNLYKTKQIGYECQCDNYLQKFIWSGLEQQKSTQQWEKPIPNGNL